ncbi:MAG: hypothetical protein ABGZ53_19665 [Fuerstiella sp.]
MPNPDDGDTAESSPSAPATCVVLLGASNLTLAWPRLMSLVRERFTDSVHVYTAHGMGRSFLLERTGFAIGKLPGILHCGIWKALPSIPETVAPCALVTDLGNDLVYGCEPVDVVAAAEESVQRLRSWNPRCRIVLTGLPVEAVRRLGWLRFVMFRSVLFPFSRLTLESVQQKTLELDERIAVFAEQHGLQVVRPHMGWYGLDPIHVRRRRQQAAFAEMLNPWDTPVCVESAGKRMSASRPTAEVRWVLGTERRTQQPSTSGDGISVFAY